MARTEGSEVLDIIDFIFLPIIPDYAKSGGISKYCFCNDAETVLKTIVGPRDTGMHRGYRSVLSGVFDNIMV